MQRARMYPRSRRLVCTLLCACLILSWAIPGGADGPDAWLESDEDLLGLTVNEGDLEFLLQMPERRVLHTRNWLTITADSLDSGWVELRQCQGNLDPIDRVEIVYRYRAMRNLRVLSSRDVGSVRVASGAVQMTQVGAAAEVCIVAEVQVLRPAGEGRFVVQSGPFHRRFLDGYYPVRLDYRVVFPQGLLLLEEIQPAGQPGFEVELDAGGVQVDALFTGRLTIRLVLRRAS